MTRLTIGIVPLIDCAVLAAAREKGFFRRHGIDATLTREASWASVRDKVAAGALDAAQMLAPMPIAATLGLEPLAGPLVAGLSLGLNGNAITVSAELWARMVAADPEATEVRTLAGRALRRVIADDRRRGRPPLRLASVYPYSCHEYELRYWLATAGIHPDDDVHLSVVPPPRIVDSLERRAIDGFCVGEPWSSLAVRRGLGRIVLPGRDVWSSAPEKVFAVRRDWAERHAGLHRAALGALLEAAAWADASENRDELAHLLADEAYVGAPAELLAASLAGRLALSRGDDPSEIPDFHVFHRHAATFPWISDAAWLIAQMIRWGQIAVPIDVLAVARRVYRPDLYREAARDVGMAAPATDVKPCGDHASSWILEGADGGIALGPDGFIDGARFDPADVAGYLSSCGIATIRLDPRELAAHYT